MATLRFALLATLTASASALQLSKPPLPQRRAHAPLPSFSASPLVPAAAAALAALPPLPVFAEDGSSFGNMKLRKAGVRLHLAEGLGRFLESHGHKKFRDIVDEMEELRKIHERNVSQVYRRCGIHIGPC